VLSSATIGLLVFGLVGCNQRKEIKVAANPPAFGSKKENSDWKGFLDGRWGMKFDENNELAKLFGMQSSTNGEEEPITEVFDFKADGTFMYYRMLLSHDIGGRWQAQDAFLALSFETLDGKPMQKRIDEIRKSAEQGTQNAVADDLFVDFVTSSLPAMTKLRLSNDKKELLFISVDENRRIIDSGSKLVRVAKEEE